MIRTSEVVLPGHPDRFCDQVADAVVGACYAVDPRAYCQVEMSVWSDQVFLTGGTSFVPAVRRLFEERFGAARVTGGGELVSHSGVRARQGLSPAFSPLKALTITLIRKGRVLSPISSAPTLLS